MRQPNHIAIIMDGNGRWAKERDLPRLVGHQKGVETVDEIVMAIRKKNIPYLTLYAFSDENWNRPQEEVSALMELLSGYLAAKREKMLSNGIRFETIGDLSKLPAPVREKIAETKAATRSQKELTLILALSYGARNEIVRAVNRLIASGTSAVAVTEADFANALDTADIPDPDLLIRTSGEYRLSNFLLWQSAYAELYFTKTMWPDFGLADLDKALEAFAKRERRFGKISEQL